MRSFSRPRTRAAPKAAQRGGVGFVGVGVACGIISSLLFAKIGQLW